jgi:RNA polymerase primary sigma factor
LRAVENFDFDRGFRFSTYATRAIRRNLYRLLVQRQKERKRYASGVEDDLLDLSDERNGPLLNETRWHELRSTLARMMKRLDSREREIIRARFGLGKQDEAETLQSLATRLGVCKERVRQLEKRAMTKLQAMAGEERIEEPREE